MTEQHHGGRIVGPDYLLAGRYRLDSKLGGGGMGSVWLANDTLLHRKVAVKQVTTTVNMDEAQAREIRRRATREGRMAARLDNPHAIAMHDVALDGGEPWLVMEYLPSRSLAKALGSVGRIPPSEVIQIGARVADALAEAHTAGIVHRDIKPGNILIADRGAALGMVKISDFGISRATGEKDDDDSDVITGTPAYFAPEVARGADPDEASDVFSLGATLYTATEGQPPFGTAADTRELLHRVALGEIQPPRRSGAMTAILLRMLEPDPKRRPTMGQARDELIALQSDGRTRASLNSPLRAADGAVPYWARRGSTSGSTERSGQRPSGTAPFATGPADTRRLPRTSYAPPPFEPAKRKPTLLTQPYLSMAIAALAILILIVVLLILL
ncbi:serine/threonine-protein kinase [Millisia brevis]|uniref:serine/threonine-protein kinase n=1 Tax=Millisia brevis TaxID=264148 RepID=UPI00082BB32E|nr:serine/threonine-protein kinase [Millisia brevis]